MKMRTMAALLSGLALTAAAAAQEPGSRQTREFVQAAGEYDTFEMMEAYSALAQSKEPDVLAFAHMMIRDHNQTSRVLTDATKRAGLKPPEMSIGAGQSPFLAALQSARGSDFDKLYWTQQALTHRSELAVAQAYAANGEAPAVRHAAAAAVPVIRSHLVLAEEMKAKMGGS